MLKRISVATSAAALLALSACSKPQEVVVAPAQTPIYAKDGSIVAYRPMVGAADPASGGSMEDAGMSMEDGDDDVED